MVNYPCAKISQSLPQVDLKMGPGHLVSCSIHFLSRQEVMHEFYLLLCQLNDGHQ
jgi:hypothetical protein